MAKKVQKQRDISGKRHGLENLKGNTFRDKPERINKNGRPPKLIHHITEELRAKGYQPVTETQIVDAYQMLLQLGEAEVKAIEKDGQKPFFLRLVAKWMQSPRGMEMLDRVMDRSFGKVLQRQMVNATITEAPVPDSGNKPDRETLLKGVTELLESIDREAIIPKSASDEK